MFKEMGSSVAAVMGPILKMESDLNGVDIFLSAFSQNSSTYLQWLLPKFGFLFGGRQRQSFLKFLDLQNFQDIINKKGEYRNLFKSFVRGEKEEAT